MIPFTLALVALRFFPSLFAFAPLITKTYFAKNLLSSLYTALFFGLIVDLFVTETPFGLTAINYTLTTLLIHRLKWFINPYKIYSVPLFTLIFSFISLILTFRITQDLLFLPLINALYAFAWFSCPVLAYDYLNKQMDKIKPWLNSLKS